MKVEDALTELEKYAKDFENIEDPTKISKDELLHKYIKVHQYFSYIIQKAEKGSWYWLEAFGVVTDIAYNNPKLRSWVDDMIIKFSSHVTILRNDTINFLKNEFLSHLINNRRLKKDFFNFDKLLYIFKDDFMKNFKLFNYSQIYLKNMTRNNYLQLIPQMLSEEGELFQILSKGDNNVNICMFMLFVIFLLLF